MEYTYSLKLNTTGSSTTWPVVSTSGGSGGSSGSYIYSGGGASGGWTSPAPRTPTALEWLDAETEDVCKLSRLA